VGLFKLMVVACIVFLGAVGLEDGGLVHVATVDHVAISPAGGRVIVFADDDTHDTLSGLLISRITVDRQPVPHSQS